MSGFDLEQLTGRLRRAIAPTPIAEPGASALSPGPAPRAAVQSPHAPGSPQPPPGRGHPARPAGVPSPGRPVQPPRYPWLHGGGLSAMGRNLLPDPTRPEPLGRGPADTSSLVRAGFSPWRGQPIEPPPSPTPPLRDRVRALWYGDQ